MTEKVKGRSRKRKSNSIRRVSDMLKKCAVWLVCISLIGTSIPMSMILASAEDEEDDDIVSECEIFSMSLDSLLESTEKAVMDEEPLSEKIYEFMGSAAGTYEKLFDTTDECFYEILPELDGEGDRLTLRTFVRLKNSSPEEVSAETDEDEDNPFLYYNVTGEEEIIFLLINDIDLEISTRIRVSTDEDMYETQLIKVPGSHEIITLDDTSVSAPLDYATVDEKEENVRTAALRIESGNNASWEGEEEPEGETVADTEVKAENAEMSGSVKINAVESASDAMAHYVTMHGTLYDAVTVDAGHAVAFSTTFADLGYEDDDTQWITYTAYSDGVAVTVKLPKDAIPEDAELVVTRHDEESNEYTEALSLIDEYKNDLPKYEEALTSLSSKDNDREAESSFTFSAGDEEEKESGMISLDLSFLVDGEEIEPEAEASVKIDASEALTEYEDGVESIEVWHMEETDDGTEPVLVASIRDSYKAADGVAEFTVESFSEFEFHYTSSATNGWAGFGANLIDENGKTISATVSSDYTINSGRYTKTVTTPYEFSIEDFTEVFITSGTYAFQYATVTDPNYGDTEHTFDVWADEEEVGANELYGSKENPVVSVKISETSVSENPNYGTGVTINSRTWHFTLTYEDGDSVTIPIYGNANGANDNGGKYCPKYLEINLYYSKGGEAVLNLGNGNGTYSDGDYTGSNGSGGDALRYGTGDLSSYIDNGKVTVNLPSENNLNKDFTVVDAIGTEGEDGYLPEITIALGKEAAYDYKLVGWINIATGEYYDVSGGSITAEIDLSNDNVFYADWISANYDHGSESDEGLREDIVSTADFVTFKLFDYNELFNLYSVALEQNGTEGETWTDSESLYDLPLLSNDADTMTPIADSFIFQNNGTTQSSVHVLSHPNPAKWNLWTANGTWADDPEYQFVLDAGEYWNITSPDSTILGMLYDTEEKSLGVHYVGDGDYLFWVDDDGYYTYDSAKSGAAYNQSEERFYVYNDNANAFFPYNDHTEVISSSNGLTDYWFGMYMEVNLYLPSSTANGSEESPVNQLNGKDMVFDFSGDDDIMIFVDGKMVSDMSGIHSTSYSRINFSTNTITYSMGLDDDGAPDTTGANGKNYVDENLDLSAGSHTMQIFYMERGASASNLKIQFNVTPAWEYESGPVQTVTVEKLWEDRNGYPIDSDDLPDEYASGVEAGLFDALQKEHKAEGENDEDVFGYTKGIDDEGRDTYTVEYTDDDEVRHKYVYTVANSSEGAALSYTQDDGTPVVYGETNSEGQVIDADGYVIAWLEDETLHLRIDRQTLSNDNDWAYVWELLDPEGAYEVLELAYDGAFTTAYNKAELEYYDYWSIIGEAEVENYLEDSGESDDMAVILTEAAQEAGNLIGNTKEAKGWVITGTADGLTTGQVKFSQIPTLKQISSDESGSNTDTTVWLGTYGMTSQSEIASLGEGAIWYIEDAGESVKDTNGDELEEFSLYCLLDGDKYYLALDRDNNSLMMSLASWDTKATFYYDRLGELIVNISEEGISIDHVRVEILEDGTINIDVPEEEAAVDDVRLYTLSETETSGFSTEIINKLFSELIIEKEVLGISDTDKYDFRVTLTQDDGTPYVGDINVRYSTGDDKINADRTGIVTFENGETLLSLSAGERITLEVSSGMEYAVTEETTGAFKKSVYKDEELIETVEDKESSISASGSIGTGSRLEFVNSYREYFPIDEEIVPDHDDRSTWVDHESVNEYNAIEIEMSTVLPVLSERDLEEGSFTMNFHEVLDSELVLDEADADFSVYISGYKIDHRYYVVSIEDDTGDDCSFHVDVDLSKLYLDGVITGDDLQGDTEIIIFFFADLEGSGLNGSYKSTVWYDVYDGEDLQYTSNYDVVTVYTYEIDVIKYDMSTLEGDDYNGSALTGATLGVYYDRACENPVYRYTGLMFAEETQKAAYTVTSGDDGYAIFYGLAEGTYYVRETEAPDGYLLSNEVLTVTIREESRGAIYNYGNTPETEEEPEPTPEPEPEEPEPENEPDPQEQSDNEGPQETEPETHSGTGGGGGYSGSGSSHSNSYTSGPRAESTAHESSGGGNSVNTDNIGGLPQTGEGSMAMILISVCVVLAAVLAVLFHIRRRTTKDLE